MSMLAKPALLVSTSALALSVAGDAAAGDNDLHPIGLGRAASEAELRAWDVDVPVDGEGAPKGAGTAKQGEAVYNRACASCHGVFGEGKGRYPALMGGRGSLDSNDPKKTVGSYWPYATTLWSYIYRAMPFGNAQSLSIDETYAVTAYVLNLNDVFPYNKKLTHKNIADVEMPNRDGFIRPDPRPDVETGSACMRDCRKQVEITGRAKDIGVTPEDRGHRTLVQAPPKRQPGAEEKAQASEE